MMERQRRKTAAYDERRQEQVASNPDAAADLAEAETEVEPLLSPSAWEEQNSNPDVEHDWAQEDRERSYRAPVEEVAANPDAAAEEAERRLAGTGRRSAEGTLGEAPSRFTKRQG